jgi:glycosyltransferase involved in cell wall biosynthesis
MKIWAYVTVWNEESMLPYYLRHYINFCERIIVLDNESTDNTVSIAKEYPNVEVRTYSTENTFNDYSNLDIKHKCIKEARGNADYVIISDCDEFIVHPNIKEFLTNNSQYSIIYPAGFQMVSNSFPIKNGQIYDEIKIGTPDPWYSKPILINPNMVHEFSWIEGCHEISLDSKYKGSIMHPVPESIRPEGEWEGHPWGKWKMQFNILDSFNEFPIKLLHFKFLGEDYVNERYTQYANRNSIQNKMNGLAMHYEKSISNKSIPSEIKQLFEKSFNINLT